MGLVKLIVKFIYIEQPLCKRQVIFNGNDRQKNQNLTSNLDNRSKLINCDLLAKSNEPQHQEVSPNQQNKLLNAHLDDHKISFSHYFLISMPQTVLLHPLSYLPSKIIVFWMYLLVLSVV